MPSNCDSTASFFSSPFLTSFQLSILQVSVKSLSHIWVETMLKQNKWNRSKLTSEWAESKQQLSAGFWKLLNRSAELRGFTSYTQTHASTGLDWKIFSHILLRYLWLHTETKQQSCKFGHLKITQSYASVHRHCPRAPDKPFFCTLRASTRPRVPEVTFNTWMWGLLKWSIPRMLQDFYTYQNTRALVALKISEQKWENKILVFSV